jgi:hypothetical protein
MSMNCPNFRELKVIMMGQANNGPGIGYRKIIENQVIGGRRCLSLYRGKLV